MPAALRGRGEGSAARSRGLRGGRSVCGGGRSCALGGGCWGDQEGKGGASSAIGSPCEVQGGRLGLGGARRGQSGVAPAGAARSSGTGLGRSVRLRGLKASSIRLSRRCSAAPGVVASPPPGFSSSSGVLWALNRAAELSVEEGVLGVVSRVQPLGMGM